MSTEEAEDSSRGRDAPERAWNAWVYRVKNAMPDMR